MKKKLMMVAVLLGALSLGACVDDNESQSVTDVRNAKTEQLKSIAALNNAQAEAALIAAKAEQALKEAQAKYQEAMAEAEKAEAEYQKELKEQAKQKFAEELKLIQAEYAAQIAKYNADKQYYENVLWNNVEEHLNKVYTCYTLALDKVNALTEQKMKQQVLKAQTEAQVITAEESLKQTLAELNRDKAEQERKLAKWEEMKKAQPSKEEYQKQLDELEKQAYDLLQNKIPAAEIAEKAAKKAFDDAKEAFDNEDGSFVKAAKALNELTSIVSTYSFTQNSREYWAEDERDEYRDEFRDYPAGSYSYFMYTLAAESHIQYATIAVDKYFADMLEAANSDIKNAEGEAWKKDDDGNWNMGESSSVKGAESYLAYTKDQIKAAEKTVNDLKTKIAEEKKKETPDTVKIAGWEQEIKSQEDYIATLNAHIPTLEADITAAKERLQDAKDEKAEIEAEQKEYQDNLKVIKDAAAQKAYADVVAAIEPLAVDYIAKQADAKRLDNAKGEIGFSVNSDGSMYPYGGLAGDLNDLINNITDLQNLIDGCNTRLAEIAALIQLGDLNNLVSLTQNQVLIYNPITGNLEWMNVYNYSITGTGVTLENAIALIDAKIKSLDEQIRINTALADKYKAELDALLK